VIKTGTLRVLTALLVITVVAVGAVGKTGFGTICSFGVGKVSFACPLGFLQAALASKDPLLQMWLPVGLALLVLIILGRFFCGWLCPTTLLQYVVRGKGAEKARAGQRAGAASPANTGRPAKAVRNGAPSWTSYSRYAVLGGGLLASFVFGFPVFCLVCPVGLFFGTVFALSRLFLRQQASLELLLFPTLLGLELLLLKNWCRSLCPLGALFGLVGRLARFGRPTVVKDKCLTTTGINCRVCKRACPQGVDLHGKGEGASVGECSRCLECYEKCPTGAIALWPFRAPKGRRKPRVAKAPKPGER
jgi:ferredoxin-type protein NapH